MRSRPPLRSSWASSDRRVPRLLARPLRRFLATESGGGLVLLAAALVALAWANSPFEDAYESLWGTRLSLSLGDLTLGQDLRHWVNDGLMTLFFFVVGLEIKRELVTGELNDARKAALPALAAVGGMVVPALIYLAFNLAEKGESGWGIPMATDIAFAVGLLALLGRRAPSGLRIFLLSLAIVDDIGAIVVIAIFYSSGLSFAWLATAALALSGIALMRRLRVWWMPAYVVVGTLAWLAMFESGVHATIAGVAIGLLTPTRPFDPEGAADALREAGDLRSEPSPAKLRSLMLQAQEVVPVGERLQELLHPWTSFVVVPLFALANAGVALDGGALNDAFTSPVTWGIIVGLVAGKLLGITLGSWLAVKAGIASLPDHVTWRHLWGAAAIAGIGFTVSLFVAGLAFGQEALTEEAKVGILAGSLTAGIVGALVLWSVPTRDTPEAEGS